MKNIQLNLIYIFSAISAFIIFNSCEKEESCDEDNLSELGSDESHNPGQNCMQCHRAGGKGEGCFVVAGTVYDTLSINKLSSGKIEFYTKPDGTGNLVHSIAVDLKGNFYSTENFELKGLYPVFTSQSGNKFYMGSSLTSGECNSCHSSSNRINGY